MSDEAPFGQQLYDALRKYGVHSLLTNLLDYAEIQDFKKADREEVTKIFRGGGYAFVQRLKEQEPEEIANYLSTMPAAALMAALMR